MANLRTKKLGLTKNMGAAISRTLKPDLTHAYFMEVPIERLRIDPDNLRNMRVHPKQLRHDLAETVAPGQTLGESLYEYRPQDLLVKDIEIDEALHEELTALQELATSIASMGVIQSIRAYAHGNDYVLIAGERRYLASVIAGKATIPAYVFNDPPSSEVIRIMQYMENHHRVDLNVMDDVFAQRTVITTIAQENGGKLPTGLEVAVRLGISKSAAYRALRFAKMPPDVIQGIKDGFLRSQNVIDRITRESDSKQRELMIKVVADTLSEREALAAIDRLQEDAESTGIVDTQGWIADSEPSLSNTQSDQQEQSELFSVISDHSGAVEDEDQKDENHNAQVTPSSGRSKRKESHADPFNEVKPETVHQVLKNILEMDLYPGFDKVIAREVPEFKSMLDASENQKVIQKAWLVFLKAVENDLQK
ncbi:MAG: ParB/RepB/Spo0J family partition protein [Thioalkalivibrio sp.]